MTKAYQEMVSYLQKKYHLTLEEVLMIERTVQLERIFAITGDKNE